MQVKKFEAPTIQEALETIKRELGPEAIILQTKKNRRGFGLLSNGSVEVTAAVSDRSIQKKQFAEHRMPEESKEAVRRLPAGRQSKVYNQYVDKHLEKSLRGTRDHVEIGAGKGGAAVAQAMSPPASPRITARRYADIQDEEATATAGASAPARSRSQASSRSPAQAAMPIEEELRHLKQMIHEMKSSQDMKVSGSGSDALMPHGSLSTPALQDAFELLVIAGVERRFAYALMKKVAFELGVEKSKSPDDVQDQLAVEIMEGVEVISPLEGVKSGAGASGGPAVVGLVGPTGVGKTTTVAKIASEALLKRNLKVGLVNVDSYKVAAFDQLATYAKILNIPFRSVASAEDLNAAIQDFQHLDLVLVDTTGRSQRDPDSLQEMKAVLDAIPSLRCQLVLSATTRDVDLYDVASRFGIFRPAGLIFSKLDEATVYGCLYNVSQRAKLPLHYFTTGQRVPEDIEEATRERVASLIMDL